MIQKYLYTIFAFTSLILISCQCSNKETQTKKILFTGDLLLDRGVRERINQFDVDHLFRPEIDSVFKINDIVIANLECPATKLKQPINKRFIFRAEPEWLCKLKNHGITHLNLANNHSMDQGRNGLVDTETNIIKSGLIPLGFGINLKKACKAQILATTPRNIYLLSSLHVPSENWTYLENKPCVCEESFNSIAIRIEQLKKEDTNAVVIIQLHWGAEHKQVPLTAQKQQAYQLMDAGADCIIGHHTHTVQTIEYYKGKPIYYSIGNFIFDQSKPINSKGLMVQLTVTHSALDFKTVPFTIKKCVPHLNK